MAASPTAPTSNEVLEGRRLLSVQEPRHLVPRRKHPLGQVRADTDIKALVDQVNREDLWREAAKDLGVAAADIPASTSRGNETFFDGKVFDPANPSAYLDSLTIKALA